LQKKKSRVEKRFKCKTTETDNGVTQKLNRLTECLSYLSFRETVYLFGTLFFEIVDEVDLLLTHLSSISPTF